MNATIIALWVAGVLGIAWGTHRLYRDYLRRDMSFLLLVISVLLIPAAVLVGRYGPADCASLKDEFACRCFALAAPHVEPEVAARYFTLANDRCPGHDEYRTRAGKL